VVKIGDKSSSRSGDIETVHFVAEVAADDSIYGAFPTKLISILIRRQYANIAYTDGYLLAFPGVILVVPYNFIKSVSDQNNGNVDISIFTRRCLFHC
jgi:hypothetical protein